MSWKEIVRNFSCKDLLEAACKHFLKSAMQNTEKFLDHLVNFFCKAYQHLSLQS